MPQNLALSFFERHNSFCLFSLFENILYLCIKLFTLIYIYMKKLLMLMAALALFFAFVVPGLFFLFCSIGFWLTR